MVSLDYLQLMLVGYLVTVAIEAPLLVALLSRRHSVRLRLFAGVWLTACTYPVVWLVLPPLFDTEPRWLYILVAETFHGGRVRDLLVRVRAYAVSPRADRC